jgi:hypothetical protein
MALEPRVFKMRVGALRALEEWSGRSGDELCSVEAG